ncbi:MAG: hypothetical protein WA991_04015 [Ornithinimicrobium sp.]
MSESERYEARVLTRDPRALTAEQVAIRAMVDELDRKLAHEAAQSLPAADESPDTPNDAI